jgi:lipopolysaccharide export system ATP-binding protein
MVDLLGMFRRRAPKRGPQGFARQPVDITALQDDMGGLVGQPMRDAPPMSRAATAAPQAAQSSPIQQARRPDVPPPQAPRQRNNGVAQPKQARSGYLAVHGVKKTYGSRQVVRGVSIYVRRGEAVGLLGPNGAGKTTVFYMITGLVE